MGKDVIIACDFSSAKETMDFLDRFGDLKPYVKIGMELFYAEGPQIVRTLKARGHKVFLDLKLHDIPNTVGKAMSVLNGLGVDMCNVHAAGASEMMQAAAKAFAGSDTLVIAVTQLTSTSEAQLHDELLISSCMEETVRSYALNARNAGLDGVVCSPLEAAAVHETCGKDFLTVTPGVRLAGDSKGDQKRVTTPAIARELGSDYIVVGRSITGAGDPLQAYRKCMEEFIDR
ncbi:MAG: orotidine-5'-phosphate decarboxylase [Bacillota bacterium]|nr:orotidine-5'-phosphate decarboxylase [Bacillota bacterium]